MPIYQFENPETGKVLEVNLAMGVFDQAPVKLEVPTEARKVVMLLTRDEKGMLLTAPHGTIFRKILSPGVGITWKEGFHPRSEDLNARLREEMDEPLPGRGDGKTMNDLLREGKAKTKACSDHWGGGRNYAADARKRDVAAKHEKAIAADLEALGL